MAQQLSGPFIVLMLVYAPHKPARGKDVQRGATCAGGNRAVAACVTVYANKYLMDFADMC